jgi:1-acyl-sn-glycerol-3-phosphate acyltransferase
MERQAGKLQTAARLVLTPPFRFCWNVTTEGAHHIPAHGGAIIAPNHVSVLDSFFVPLVVGRRMTYVGKAEYMDDWKTKWLFPAIGMIPIDRSGGDSAQRALDAAAEVLDAGELFGIYPEGTRSRNGKLHKGHTGMARLALRTGAPIVPVGIIGSDDVQPPDAKFPTPFRRVHIRFGRPISVDRYVGRADDRLLLRQITDEVMFEIRNLSGQEYVDSYAGKSGKGTVAPVVPLPERAPAAQVPQEPASASTRVRIASAANSPGVHDVAVGADGLERRSSSAAIRSRPLDLDLELSTA